MQELTVDEFLMQAGTPVHMKGYQTLKRAIEITMNDFDAGMCDTLEVIGKEHGCTFISCERATRYAITKCYKTMDPAMKNKLFHGKERVTMKEFVKTAAYAIKNNLV